MCVVRAAETAGRAGSARPRGVKGAPSAFRPNAARARARFLDRSSTATPLLESQESAARTSTCASAFARQLGGVAPPHVPCPRSRLGRVYVSSAPRTNRCLKLTWRASSPQLSRPLDCGKAHATATARSARAFCRAPSCFGLAKRLTPVTALTAFPAHRRGLVAEGSCSALQVRRTTAAGSAALLPTVRPRSPLVASAVEVPSSTGRERPATHSRWARRLWLIL